MDELWHYEIWTPWRNRLLTGNLVLSAEEAEALARRLDAMHKAKRIEDFRLDPGAAPTNSLAALSKELEKLEK